MATTFQLRVVTPQRVLLDEQVREVTASGTVGEFGVLPEHITFLSSLEPGALSYRGESGTRRLALRGGFAEVVDDVMFVVWKDAGKFRRLAIRGGFAEVVNDVMTILADDAVFAEEVDAERARSELAEAEEKLEGLSSYDAEFADIDAERRWAQARIDAAGTPH